jgi:pyocin large subunit-like protein
MTLGKTILGGSAALALIGLAACDNGPSAVRARDRDASASSGYGGGSSSGRSESYADNGSYSSRSSSRYADRDSGGGDTWWAGSKKYPAAESADYHFKRDGGDFGASDVKDYVAKAHAFIAHPPHGVQTLKRKNGDTLIYDPKGNVFAVATRDGAPRTMFKPRDGAAYWDQQKQREADGGDSSYRSRASRGGNNNDDQG